MSIAWVFPGQGSQTVGMGKSVHARSAAARDVFARADEALGEPLSRLIFEGPESELTLTSNAQPALVTVSAALLAALAEQHPSVPPPAYVAGHSLGEFSALVATGALSLEDGVRVVRARGAAMQRAVPECEGGMAAALGLSLDDVRAICDEAAEGQTLAIANHNAPGQIAISGHADAVERACDLIDDRGGRAVILNVSAPFHSPLMAPAASAVRDALARATMTRPSCPVIANVDAEAWSDPEDLRAKLVQQVDAPVLWDRTVRKLAELGVTRALEIGPGDVLTKLGKRIDVGVAWRGLTDDASLAEAARFLG